MTRRTKIILAVAGAVMLSGLGVFVLGVVLLLKSGVTRPVDNIFGDQHLKTAVALIELHKARFDRYPQGLSDLRYVGTWDQIALNAVDYCANSEGTAYFVEVRRGWVGRPDLKMPEDFWQGTGFDRSLGPCK